MTALMTKHYNVTKQYKLALTKCKCGLLCYRFPSKTSSIVETKAWLQVLNVFK